MARRSDTLCAIIASPDDDATSRRRSCDCAEVQAIDSHSDCSRRCCLSLGESTELALRPVEGLTSRSGSAGWSLGPSMERVGGSVAPVVMQLM